MATSHECAVTEQQVTSRHTATFNGVIYDVYKLIEFASTLPEESVATELFGQLKEEQCWTDMREEWLGPSNIIALAQKYDCHWPAMILANLNWAQHIRKVRDAQYDRYPLLVVDEHYVIDGMHRLTKAWLDQATAMRIKRFSELPAEAVVGKKL